MNPSEETDRLAKDASLLPIIADQINQSVDRLGTIINDFGKYLDDTAPDISTTRRRKRCQLNQRHGRSSSRLRMSF